MQMKIKMDDESKKVVLKIKGLDKVTSRAIRRAFYYIGKDLVKESKRLIKLKPKHGLMYYLRLKGKMVWHRASAPAEAPANFTGSLKSSIDYNVVGSNRLIFGSRKQFLNKNGMPVNLKTRKGVIYGKYLEEGTKKMAARPFLKPAIKSNYRNMQKHFEEQIKRNIKGSEIA